MQKLIIKDKKNLENEIKISDTTAQEIYLNISLTAKDIVTILNHYPKLNTIHTTPTGFKLTSNKIKKALQKSSITFKKTDIKRGRPLKYNPAKINRIKLLAQAGKPIKIIAHEEQIPLRTAYAIAKP